MLHSGTPDAGETISILGYCSSSPEEIRARLATGPSLRDLTNLPGNYVIVIQSAKSVAIITSKYSLVPYMYVAVPGGLCHGPGLGGVLQAGGLGWEWDFSSLADYICFGHLSGTRTLHARVKRTAPGSVVAYCDGRLSVDDVSGPVRPTSDAVSPDQAVRCLSDEVARWWRPGMVLCLSGGLDSRLLLSALVAQGIRPDVLVAGQDGSFDRQVATTISDRFGLRLYRDEIRAADFIANASEIIESTNGLLPFNHWPGILLAARATAASLVLGWNGEFARSFYLDKGRLSLVLDRLPARSLVRSCMRSKLRSPFDASEADRLHPELASQLSERRSRGRLDGVIDQMGQKGMGMALDEFFLEQYGLHKTGADVSAIRAFRDCILPFFSSGWIDLVRSLPRRWKLGSRFHRYAIGELCADLLEFPEVRSGVAVPRTVLEPAPFYWTAGHPSRWITHSFNQSFYDDVDLIECMGSEFASLSEIIDPNLMLWSQSDPSRRQRFFHLAPVATWYGRYLRHRQSASAS